jgi:putative transcriptional regulator
MTQHTENDSAKLWADELYRAIDADPGEIFKELFAGLGLKWKKDGN